MEVLAGRGPLGLSSSSWAALTTAGSGGGVGFLAGNGGGGDGDAFAGGAVQLRRFRGLGLLLRRADCYRCFSGFREDFLDDCLVFSLWTSAADSGVRWRVLLARVLLAQAAAHLLIEVEEMERTGSYDG